MKRNWGNIKTMILLNLLHKFKMATFHIVIECQVSLYVFCFFILFYFTPWKLERKPVFVLCEMVSK